MHEKDVQKVGVERLRKQRIGLSILKGRKVMG